MKAKKIDDWYVTGHPVNTDFIAPDTKNIGRYVVGKTDGNDIRTSVVQYKADDTTVLSRSGTSYVLGEPVADYVARYPDAKKVFFNSLPLAEVSFAKDFDEPAP